MRSYLLHFPLPELPRLTHFGFHPSFTSPGSDKLHHHFGYELKYFFKGKSSITLTPDLPPVAVEMGDLLITSPDFSHTFASPAPLGFWWLGFQTGPRVATATHSDFPAIGAVKHELQVRYREQVDRDLADLSENLEIPRFAILHRMPQARRILKDIGEELREKHPHAHLMVHARLLELFTLVLRRFEASAAARPYPEIEYLKNHLEAHPDEAVSLSRMADLTGLSPFYISRRFREATGMPPVRFAMKVRMEHAKELLASGLAVGEVAAKCGFRDLFHFSRAFKGTVGMAPTRYARGADE